MLDLQGFYTSQKDKHALELQRVKKRLALLATLRLSVFAALALGVYLFWGTAVVYALFPLGIGWFVYLVIRFMNVKRYKAYVQRLIDINTKELEILARRYNHLPDGKEFLQPDHPYAQDLDLFGRGSFYQYANRTTLVQGKEVFSSLLLDGYPKDIAKKQEAIQELAQLPEWRQRFSALAGETKPRVSPDLVSNWMKNHTSFTPKWVGMVTAIFVSISIALIA